MPGVLVRSTADNGDWVHIDSFLAYIKENCCVTDRIKFRKNDTRHSLCSYTVGRCKDTVHKHKDQEWIPVTNVLIWIFQKYNGHAICKSLVCLIERQLNQPLVPTHSEPATQSHDSNNASSTSKTDSSVRQCTIPSHGGSTRVNFLPPVAVGMPSVRDIHIVPPVPCLPQSQGYINFKPLPSQHSSSSPLQRSTSVNIIPGVYKKKEDVSTDGTTANIKKKKPSSEDDTVLQIYKDLLKENLRLDVTKNLSEEVQLDETNIKSLFDCHKPHFSPSEWTQICMFEYHFGKECGGAVKNLSREIFKRREYLNTLVKASKVSHHIRAVSQANIQDNNDNNDNNDSE